MATSSTIVLGLKDSITIAVKNLRIVVKHDKSGVNIKCYDDDKDNGLPFREEKIFFDEEFNERERLAKEMGHYISNDEDYENIIPALKKALKERPNDPLESVDEILVWEKVEGQFTVKDFCETIGLN